MADGTDSVEQSITDLDSAFTFAWDESTEEGEDTEVTDAEVEGDNDSPEPDAEGDESEGDASPEDESESEEPDEGDEDEDKYVVKVKGEEIEVSLDELANGYMRQADYTQKTQALAQEREELAAYKTLAEAIQADPKAVILSLAERFGVSLNSGVDNTLNGVPLDPNDPIEAELLALRQQNAELASKFQQTESERQRTYEDQRKAEVLRQIEDIKRANNDPDLDEGELLRFAVEHQVGDLNIAYSAMRAHKPEPPSIRKIKAKRTAPPVEGGGHRAGVREGAPDKRMSLEEALAEAISLS